MRRLKLILAAAGIVLPAAALSIYVMGGGEVHAPAFPTARAETAEPQAGPVPLMTAQPAFLPPEQRQPAPAITMIAGDGTELGLDHFLGKVVVLNFWATWCAPCVEELPSLARLHEKLEGQGVVVALSVDRGGLDQVMPFLEEYGITIDPYVDASMTAMRIFRLSGLPTTVIIDAQGREIGRVTGPAVWDDEAHVALIKGFIAEVQSETDSSAGSPQP